VRHSFLVVSVLVVANCCFTIEHGGKAHQWGLSSGRHTSDKIDTILLCARPDILGKGRHPACIYVDQNEVHMTSCSDAYNR
jgi:hypothetical protein